MSATEVVFVDTHEKAMDCFNAVLDSPGMLYWDTETTGLLVRSGTQDKGRLLQISVRPWDKAWAFDIRTKEWRQAIKAIFHEADAICAHNTKFDLHVTATYGIDLLEMFEYSNIYDTVWLAHFHDERESRALKDLGSKYLGMDAASEQRKLKKLMTDNKWNWETVPLRHLVEYGGMDTILGGQLFDLLYPRVEPYATEAIRREQRLLPYVYAMERNGIRIDVDGLQAMKAQQAQAMDEALGTLAEVFGTEVVPKSDRDKKDALNLASGAQLKMAFRKLGAAIDNTQAVTFHKLAATGTDGVREAATALLAYKHAAKLLSTYLEAWERDITEAGRIHPSFNTLGTVTGRFSSSGPNFQNVSKSDGLRDLIIADDAEQTMVVADYEQMELRQFAHYAEDERMRAAFISGDDLYQQAADVMGVTRDIGKMITLASQYGAGWKKTKEQAIAFAYKLGQSERVPELHELDWQGTMEKFHKAYKVRHLQWLTEAQAQRRGNYGEMYVRTFGGRRMRPKLMTHNRGEGLQPVKIQIFKDLGNSLIQGSCADIMKESIIAVGEAGYGDNMRLTVHDELVLSVPTADAPKVLAEVLQIMERKEYVPELTATGDIAFRYGKAK